MLKSIAVSANRFIRNWIYSLSYVLYLVVIILYGNRLLEFFKGIYIDTLKDIGGLGLIAFIYFLFLSYEFTSESRRVNGNEILESIDGAGVKSLFSQIIILTIAIIPTFLIALSLIFRMNAIVNIAYDLFYIHSIKVIFRYIFTPALIGVLLGAALRTSSRVFAYACMLVTSLLVANIFTDYTSNVTIGSFEIARIFDWFQLTIPDAKYAPDGIYGIPMETSRLLLPLLWIFLLLGISIYQIRNRRRKSLKIVSVSFLILSILVSGLFLMRGDDSVKYTGGRPSSYVNLPETSYYNKERGNIEDLKNQFGLEPSFGVTNYSMDLKPKRNLEALVEITVDDPNLETYLFTLHHSYHIQELYDENHEAIPYTRNSDYLIISPQTKLEKFTVNYVGTDRIKFFSNNQNLTLPGYHAYYPRAGFYELWNYGNNSYRANTAFGRSNYQVRVEANYSVAANIEEQSENTFTGESETLTLIGGYIDEPTNDGVQYVYGPMSGQSAYFDVEKANELGREIKKIIDLDQELTFDHKKIFMNHIMIKQSGRNEEPVVFSDHVLLSDIQPTPEVSMINYLSSLLPKDGKTLELENSFIKRVLSTEDKTITVKPERAALAIIQEYERLWFSEDLFSMTEEEQLEALSLTDKYAMALETFDDLVAYQIGVYGREPVLKAMYKYMTSENPEVYYVDFIYNIEEYLA